MIDEFLRNFRKSAAEIIKKLPRNSEGTDVYYNICASFYIFKHLKGTIELVYTCHTLARVTV